VKEITKPISLPPQKETKKIGGHRFPQLSKQQKGRILFVVPMWYLQFSRFTDKLKVLVFEQV
jgi:hypothetical protein